MNSTSQIRIAFSVGELSGDEHTAHVVRALSGLLPGCEMRGMGGRNMRNAGFSTVVDSEVSASVMGFTALLGSATKIFRAMGSMRQLLREWKPDLLVLTDYPDFNLSLAHYARKHNIPTLYFIPPKVWAWRGYRVNQIADWIDHLAVIFPFEVNFYRSHGLANVTYVGHPMHDTIDCTPLNTEQRNSKLKELGLTPEHPVVGLFPGSRKNEIGRHLPQMRAAFDYLRAHIPQAQAIISVAPTMDPALIEQFAKTEHGVVTSSLNSVDLLKLVDAATMKSGTSNLQAAFVGTPFTMCYNVSKRTEFIMRPILKIKQFSPVNVVRPNTIRELMQEPPNAERMGPELLRLVSDVQYRDSIKDGLQETVALLSNNSEQTCATNVAELIVQQINRGSKT